MGMVSFISTIPSLLPLPAPATTSPAISRYPIPSSKICCKIEADNDSEDQFGRRDILKCFGATIGMEIIASSSSFVKEANAADLIQRRQRSEFQSSIKNTLYTAIKENQYLIPSLLTLALNDIMTYDKATKSGGPNGSIRFSSEINRPENKVLTAALYLLDDAKKEIDSYSKGGPVSYADLIQCAAQSAVKSTFLASAIRKCGGNEEKGNLLYTAYGSNGQWGLFDRQFGRSDAPDADPEGRVPQWEKASVQEMKDKFAAVGFGPRQLAVMSAFLGPDQLATEALLAADPAVAPWVTKYQRSRETVSETDYEVDLITALTKMSSLGQQIDYEAYTYPVQRVDLSKLKL
ncbi:thylakoid lumenal 29 kDa protein, chloroplastic isoform X1 [Rhododendron vialii]|uniref:thylakoid lumenal 29 kDa protein, chloroplastic isoform X1 n=1 Tax=Rhododendron vialii TaxID=182163 RepID=UPI00265EB78D|nr:thylakoid lumenal 29 kDa protein, chloroplastic isoform X1 [Rhododendron vialii]